MDEDKTVKIIAAPTAVISARGPAGLLEPPEETANTERSSSDDDEEMQMYSRSKSTSRSSTTSMNSSMRSSYASDLHMLTSTRPGESKVERMAKKIQKRIEEQVPVTFKVRKQFLKTCRRIAVKNNYEHKSRVLYSDIIQFHKDVKQEAEEKDAEGFFSRFVHSIGVLSDPQLLLGVLEKAIKVGDDIGMEEDDEFFYQEFSFFHTNLVSRWPWFRYELLFAFGLVLMFYVMTPILFCVIMHDDGICPRDTKVPGWVSALYFASTTMSTVGYGDLTVEKDEWWKIVIGMLYMMASTMVAILAFSAAAESAATPIKNVVKYIADRTPLTYPEGPLLEGEYLYQRIRKVRMIMLADVAFQFILLNLVGILASQAFIALTEVDPNRQWDWIDSMYWAVQTTTTIGYGDYAMPEYMRIFQIFYLTLGAYFTGSALGRLAEMKDALEELRRYHAFERRQVNKHMMHYLASTDDPSRVDQYEFVIAQLLNLSKIDTSDIEPIMDKYRSLAGASGYIRVAELEIETDINYDDSEEFAETEGVEGAS